MTLLGREIVKSAPKATIKQKWPIFEASWGERYFRMHSFSLNKTAMFLCSKIG